MADALPNDNSDVDQLGAKLSQIKTDIQEVVSLSRSLAGDKLSSLGASAMKGGKAAMDGIATCVKEHPMRSALVAIGIGAVVGYLLRRR